jgi:hypothetical protein
MFCKCAGPSRTATLIGGTSSPVYRHAFQLQNRDANDRVPTFWPTGPNYRR